MNEVGHVSLLQVTTDRQIAAAPYRLVVGTRRDGRQRSRGGRGSRGPLPHVIGRCVVPLIVLVGKDRVVLDVKNSHWFDGHAYKFWGQATQLPNARTVPSFAKSGN